MYTHAADLHVPCSQLSPKNPESQAQLYVAIVDGATGACAEQTPLLPHGMAAHGSERKPQNDILYVHVVFLSGSAYKFLKVL